MTRYSSKSWRSLQPQSPGARGLPAPIRLVAHDCRVLGLDPGSQRTGYGVIDCRGSAESHVASGCVDVVGHDMVERLQRIYAAVSLGARVHEYAPRAIKMAVTGYGAAAKPQVAQMVRTLLLLEIKLAADAADALAVALCHAQTRRIGALAAIDAVDVA